MVGHILLAGYTLTDDEWAALEPELRAELLGVAQGRVELHPDEGEAGGDLLQ